MEFTEHCPALDRLVTRPMPQRRRCTKTRTYLRPLLVGLGLAFVSQLSAMPESTAEDQKVTASDAAEFDEFGISVAVDGNTAVVGAHEDNLTTGAAYVYALSGGTWAETQKLTASDAAEDDEFGRAVTLSGSTALIGAFRNDRARGAVYVFERSGALFSEQIKLIDIAGSTGDQFGRSIDLDGNVAVVGSPRKKKAGDLDIGSGAAIVFRKVGSTWQQEQTLIASDGAEGDNFGTSVAVSGNRIIVGANADDNGGSSSGSAYVFEWNGTTWSELSRLNPSDPWPGDEFGIDVDIAGPLAVIGAYRNDDDGTDSGAAYLFEYANSSWQQRTKLLASDANFRDHFGNSVAIDGSIVAVGSFNQGTTGARDGAAYLFSGTELPDQTGVINEYGVLRAGRGAKRE